MRIAVVGSGVSGLVAAHHLHRDHDLTVFEADSRLGGHANTVEVEVDDAVHRVDTGFIVYNEANYPGFVALLAELGVATQPTAMSFSVSDARSGLEYRGSNVNTLFAQRRNLANPSFIRLLTEIARFNRAARRLVAHETRWDGADRLPAAGEAPDDETGDESIEAFLRRGRYSRSFVEQFLVPFGSAIWSADPSTFTRFPVRSYARFMRNHGLLGLAARTQWRTVSGGSRSYVDALSAGFAHRARLSTAVHKIVPHELPGARKAVEVLTDRGPELFDRVIIAAHSDQALRMLGNATATEQSVLGAIAYQPNCVTLHTDARLLPERPRARASWNYWIGPGARRAAVTYWMNSLQGIRSARPLLVTLNRSDAIDPGKVLAEFEYEHPVFDAAAIRAQRMRHEIQGTRGVYFAGAYWGYGFHEDGVQSALEVSRAIADER
jgi:predicted NAD/FAD-binding protein